MRALLRFLVAESLDGLFGPSTVHYETDLRPGAYMLWVDGGELQLARKDWTRWFAVKQRLSAVTNQVPHVG